MKKATAGILVLLILLFSFPVVYAGTPNIDARAYILIDSKTGQIIAENNSTQKEYPASTTKIMTAILGLEKGNPDQVMTASLPAVNDIGEGGMNIGIMAGEQLKLSDLLHALLIKSANETANIIAENVCPTRKDFIDLMNTKADELGATNTHFVNTCGIHNDEHYTTAGDMAKIARYAMTIPGFREIVKKTHYTMPLTNKHDKKGWGYLGTTNRLFDYKSDYYTEVTGIKTGYTSQARNCLVASAIDKNGMELISVVLGVKNPPGETHAIFKYSKELLEYGFKQFSIQNVIPPNQLVKKVQVQDAEKDSQLELVTAEAFNCALPLDKNDWNVNSVENINPVIKAPIKKGDVLGSIKYERNGIRLGEVKLIAAGSVEKSIRTKIADVAGKPFGPIAVIRNILKFTAIVLLVLIALRIVLKRISAAIKTKAQGHEQ